MTLIRHWSNAWDRNEWTAQVRWYGKGERCTRMELEDSGHVLFVYPSDISHARRIWNAFITTSEAHGLGAFLKEIQDASPIKEARKPRNVWLGKSGQHWIELKRTDKYAVMKAHYQIRLEYCSMMTIPLNEIIAVCGFKLIGITENNGKTIDPLPSPQEPINGQEEPQSPQETIPREVRFQAYQKARDKASEGYRGLLAKELSEAVAQGLTPIKCKECCGNGLDHPCSAKSRNTDDDTCPRCKGTGIEPCETIQFSPIVWQALEEARRFEEARRRAFKQGAVEQIFRPNYKPRYVKEIPQDVDPTDHYLDDY